MQEKRISRFGKTLLALKQIETRYGFLEIYSGKPKIFNLGILLIDFLLKDAPNWPKGIMGATKVYIFDWGNFYKDAKLIGISLVGRKLLTRNLPLLKEQIDG